MRFSTLFLSLLLIFSASEVLLAQSQNLTGSDVSQVDVSELSDNQIRQYIQRAESAGLSQTQVEQQLRQRGMSAAQLSILRQRIREVRQEGDTRQPRQAEGRQRTTDRMQLSEREFEEAFSVNDSIRAIERRIFGYNLFSSEELTFEPSLQIPTPKNYQLGPGDELIIDVWGAAQMTYQEQVNTEGNIKIENLGPIYVNGMDIEEARERIISRLGSIYSGLRNPGSTTQTTFANVSLNQVRSIKVSLIGEVKHPGTYTLPSLATVFNALYLSGGPAINGSFRSIDVIRENEVISTLDLYDFLIHGSQADNIRLQDQDIIKVNPYRTRIDITGQIKRGGLFEVKSDETLSDLVHFAGDFSGNAYRDRVKVYRNTPRERSILDVMQDEFDTFTMQNGDSVAVGRILDRFANRVQIEGAVFRPGDYQHHENSTVYDLIQRADGLRDDAFVNRGTIIRLRDNFRQEIIPFDIRRIMEDPENNDIPLQRDDIVRIASIFDLEEEFTIHIYGAVQEPDEYEFYQNMTLEDLIKSAGGFLERASEARIEVSRRVIDADPHSPTSRVSEIFYFDINRDLSLRGEAADFVLKPFDQIFIRSSPGYQVQRNVRVTGEVLYPGRYTISSKTDRLSDLVERSGGLTAEAYPKGATLIREINPDNGDDEEVRSTRGSATDEDTLVSTDFLDEITDEEFVVDRRQDHTRIGIDLERILQNPGSKYDLLLREGDRLEIPQELQTVRLSGSVFQQIDVRYDDNLSFRDYINQAGGYAESAWVRRSYVIYANGSIDRTRTFLGIRRYPEIKPGAEIVVPMKPERPTLTTGERISIASTIVSMSAIVANTIYQMSR